MIDQCEVLRVKKSAIPSGENVGEPSLAGPEMTPGANTSGTGNESAEGGASCVEDQTESGCNIARAKRRVLQTTET